MDVPLQIIDRYKQLQEDKLVFGKMRSALVAWLIQELLADVEETENGDIACSIEIAISYHCGRYSFATLALSKGSVASVM